MISPIVVANDKAIVASADNHLYALTLGEGYQQWRFNVGTLVRFAPAVQDNFIYFADEQGRVFGLQDWGNTTTQILAAPNLASVPQSNMYLAGNRLLLITRLAQGNQEYQLHFIDRTNGGDTYFASPIMAPWLGVGNQLVYVGVPKLSAFDINDKTIVWTNPEVENITASPVFVLNGPRALAELYVADNKGGGRLHAIDANTGQILWTTAINREVNGIAVGDTAVYITGDGFMRALVRQGGNPLWETGIAGRAMGGPLIDGSQILVVTSAGSIQGVNLSGQTIGNQSLPPGLQVVGSPAVSGPNLYIPASDSIVYAFRGQP